MAKIATLFIDKGGVLLGNAVSGAHYRRLLGEYLPTELGGNPEAWANANVRAFDRAWARYLEASRSALPTKIRDWYAEDDRLWLYDMCDDVGVPRPPASQADASRRPPTSGDQHDGLVQYLGSIGASVQPRAS